VTRQPAGLTEIRRAHFHRMKTLQSLGLLFLCARFSSAQTTFTNPSEAYEYARRPLTEWETAIREHRKPKTPTIRPDIVQDRGKALCPSFSLDSTSGEQLYWLAKLCEEDNPKATSAIERYLAGADLAHGPDARMLLSQLQMEKNRNWQDAWGSIQTILQEDPMEAVQDFIGDIVDEEGAENPTIALEWSKQRYEIMIERNQKQKLGVPPVSTDSVLMAGYDLVHRYYLVGKTDQARDVLDEMNHLEKSHPVLKSGWGATELRWANLEMHAPPQINVLKAFGPTAPSGLITTGRVEVISFFFLECPPCMEELSQLDALQKRYGPKKIRIIAVTTYEANSYLSPSTHANIESSLKTALSKKAPRIGVVITSEKTLVDYGVNGFPVSAVVDKRGIVRHVGAELDFDDDLSTGHLISNLIQE
jgi:thiol-disulfide isomerase/thioredoxin